jgi:ATP-dependent Lhr-like helicase
MSTPDQLGPATRAWFERAFAAATPVQARGWERIAAGDHALLVSPTGSGKTLAAFLWCIDRLYKTPRAQREGGVRVLYVSPLKALAYDVEKNLRVPLRGIEAAARELGLGLEPPRIAIRSGDTSARERRLQLRDPAEILVTTPESLYLMLGSRAREALASVDTVIVDEVHALAPTKRGAHLALSLERLAALTTREPQRIGLSATARPLELVARFLGGDRPVSIVDAAVPPALDMRVVVPTDDMTRPVVAEKGERTHGIWPVIIPELVSLIRGHTTTILFVNSRALSERLAQRINDEAGEALVRAHHGSLAHAQRREAEELLKQGNIAGIVATSSLELGIDMGSVDLVILVESPGAVARGLQRVGRAGHSVGVASKGRLFPKHRGDLLEAAVVVRRMQAGELEPIALPRNPLDVLAQHIVALSAVEPIAVAALARLVKRTASFAELPASALSGVLDMLSGLYPSTDFSELRPRVVWDRDKDVVSGREGSRMLASVSGGTIPDRGLYPVHLMSDGARLGELDEEMVHESQPGHVITLGASSWRVEQITRDRVLVTPAPGEVGRMPFWHGDGPGRPIELGRAVGAAVRELLEHGPEATLERDYALDALAVKNLAAYLRAQLDEAGAAPTDRAIVVERFRDELGDRRICILSPFGARVHAPWALALETRWSERVQSLWGDDGICLRVVDADTEIALTDLLPSSGEVEERVMEALGSSSLFASRFRENAARALLLPRRRPGSRTPLWQQRLRSQQLLKVASGYPSFPIVVETYRECLEDVFDMPALVGILAQIESGAIAVHEAHTRAPSPFARSLVFAFVAAYLYQGDAPREERRVQALSLDRGMLRELLGGAEERELLDAEVIAELEAELQLVEHAVPHADALHDRLRRLGVQTQGELRPHRALLEELVTARRAVALPIGHAAAEDAGLYRDALGVTLPEGLPAAFLAPVERALEGLLSRYARTHGPFTLASFAERHGVDAREAATALEAAGRLTRGAFLPDGTGDEWCDVDVLRRIKRRTLARLRAAIEPVDRATFARFLPAWHGVTAPRSGVPALEQALVQLEGMPLSYAELERAILPSRVSDFHPRMLDELGASGWLVWVGRGAAGATDGRVALYRRAQARRLLDVDDATALSPAAQAILEQLARRGACFFLELEGATPNNTTLIDALWELVWAGLVTNDTFQPLRALGMRRPTTKSRGRPRTDVRTAGRWSLVSSLFSTPVSPTERSHAQALMLLERHGIVSREALELEALPGGFSAVYPVLAAMEEAGKVRRGYFVAGIGAQFASAGAVERLRAMRVPPAEAQVLLLSAADPANPYGWIVPWPELAAADVKPQRASGATLALVDGEPALLLARGRQLLTFAGIARDALARGMRALSASLAKTSRRAVRIDRIDGKPAHDSRHVELLRELGLSVDHRGLVIERRL